jgi:hypothetical protein
VIEQVRAAAQLGHPILFAVDGFKAYLTVIVNVFRDPLYTGKPGRPRLLVWDELHIVQVVKQRLGRRLVSIARRLAYGCLARAEEMMQMTQVELGCINTAYIERLNATLRTWMPALARRTRRPSGARSQLEAALFWTGCVYNFLCERPRPIAASALTKVPSGCVSAPTWYDCSAGASRCRESPVSARPYDRSV